MTIFAYALLAAAGVCLAQAVWALIASIGYRKGETVRGYACLERTEYKPNVNTHDRMGHFVRYTTKAWYTYTADGREYTIAHVFDNVKPGELQKTVNLIYWKKRPGSGYLKGISLPREPFECCVFGFLGLLLVAAALIILL
ncbi:MAG: hypothetical protein IJJ99_08820 [Oscillospiraceae bacterium]|nr:hypothetical protein [Oscillospiraceae bacterium]